MIDVYVLGDRIICTGLQNRAIDIFQEASSQETVALDTIIRAIEKVPVDSRLLSYHACQLASDMLTTYSPNASPEFEGHEKWLQMIEPSTEFTSKVLTELLEVGRGYRHADEDPASEGGCRWHIYTDGKDWNCERCPYSKKTRLFLS
jgi:hypothetical protein